MPVGQPLSSIARYTCSIITVDPTQRLIEVNMQGSGARYITIVDVPIAFRWPVVGEKWVIRQENSNWYLDGPVPTISTATSVPLPIEGVTPGNAIINSPTGVIQVMGSSDGSTDWGAKGNWIALPYAANYGNYGSQRLNAAILADTPVSYYRQNETSGTVAVDTMGVNNGTYSSAVGGGSITSVAGGLVGDTDKAMSYASGTDAILGNPVAFQATTIAVEFMMKSTQAADAGYHAFLVKRAAYCIFQFPTTGTFGIYDETGGIQRDTGIAVNDGVWHHILVNFQSGVSAGTLVYLDGELVLVTQMTYTGAATNNVSLAADYNGANAGAITLDEVAIYGATITPNRVAAHYAGATAYGLWQAGQYSKDPLGIVRLRGVAAKTGALWNYGDTIATLPLGYRPALKEPFTVMAKDLRGTTTIRIVVNPDGTIVFDSSMPPFNTNGGLERLDLSPIQFQQDH